MSGISWEVTRNSTKTRGYRMFTANVEGAMVAQPGEAVAFKHRTGSGRGPETG